MRNAPGARRGATNATSTRHPASDRKAWTLLALATPVLVGLYTTLLLGDDAFTWLIEEEHPIELSGALALLACSVLCFLSWRRARQWPPVARLSLLVLAVLFVFGAGEEVSWGQRVLGIETPDAVERVNEQGELNLHNLESFSGLLDADRLFQLFWLVFAVAIPLLALHHAFRRRLARLLPILPAPFALAFLVNQALTWSFNALLTNEPHLYNSSVPLEHSIFEIKETGVSLLLAIGLWLVWRSISVERTHAGGVPPL